MNFQIYEQQFRKKAREKNKNEEYIDSCLNYARKLHEQGLPVIYDNNHFSKLVGIRLEYLISISNSQRNYYRYFTIPKKNGKSRKIAEPLPLLKEVQYFILNNIISKIPCSVYSKAYKKGSKLKSNARFHRNKQFLIKMDIEDYFPSLNQNRVYNFFYSLGYNETVSVLLTKLCTLNDGLPQGAPTSPYLSNLLTKKLDEDIFVYCNENGHLCYTRYADDISISGDLKPSETIKNVNKIIANNGLKINKKKTVVVPHSKRQVVTGIVVNEKLQATKDYRRSIRLEMYYCMKYGIDEHILRSNNISDNEGKYKYCQKMLGKINYCLQINPKDKNMLSYRDFMITEINKIQ